MRVISDDEREVIVTDEGITSVGQLQSSLLSHAQYLNLAFNALTSLQGLEMATQLRNLNVSHNALTSLRGIEALTQLRLLRCHGNQLSDLSWLTSLPHLQELWVQENQVEMAQIAHLATLPTLQTLLLHPNPCTNATNYISLVVKTVPWLTRVDLVEVDEPLRQQSQHVDERELLASAASDVSEISLMTSRSYDVEESETPATTGAIVPTKETNTLSASPSNTSTTSSTPAATNDPIQKAKPEKKKKMTAEDFMRAFPVQDFIPADATAATSTTPAQSPAKTLDAPSSRVSEPVVPNRTELQISSNQTSPNQPVESYDGSVATTPEPMPMPQPPATTNTSISSISAIASAVLTLPLFDGDGVLAQKKKKAHVAKPLKKAGSTGVSAAKKPVTDPALVSFQQQEYTLAYPASSSAVNAIQIRSDGSALAKWPNGSVAVSIDRERDGFRCYAAHKDGTIALSFDADGVGFINYYPSGRMMISTSSSGDGLFFSSDGATILRQWDAALSMKNDKWEATDKLSDATKDGALAVKLSDGLGIRLELKRPGGVDNQGDTTSSSRSSAIRLQILFAAGVAGIRHAFCNSLNMSEPNGDLCDAVLGKEPVKLKKQATSKHTHSATLDDIRAAVAKLG